MDIHKPKPIHNLKELATEFGVIVLGILTALGLEQAVENYHERQQVLETREAIEEELRTGLASAHVMADQQGCQMRQMSLLADVIGKGDLSRAREMLRAGSLMTGLPTSTQTWATALASDVSNQIDAELRAKYAGAFFVLERETEWTGDFYRSAGRLRALLGTGLAQSPATSAAAAEELAEAISILGNKQGAFEAFAETVEQGIGLKVTQDDIDRAIALSNAQPGVDVVAECEAAAKALEAMAGGG